MTAKFSVTTNAKLFTFAHKLAKVSRQSFNSYREAFANALREAYKAVAQMSARCAEIARKAMVKAAPKMVKGLDRVARNLRRVGCKIWQGRRIYVNYHAGAIFADYDNYIQSQQRRMGNAYYDLTDHQWHDITCGTLRDAFAA